MTVSGNVQQDTMKALRESATQTEAAAKLGISQPALYYRLKHDPTLMDEAVRRGLIRGKEIPAVAAAKEILGAETTSDVRTEATVQDLDENPEPLIAFKGAVVFLGERLWVDVRVERR